MKFTVTMKDPDGPHYSFDDLRNEEEKKQRALGLSERDAQALAEMHVNDAREFASQWLDYGEYVTIEFDTDAGTASVRKEQP